MDWTEIVITVPSQDIEKAGNIAHMTVPYGIYIEDYRTLEQETMEIAHIDLIDEELLNKDRSKGLVHIYISPQENPNEAVSFIKERLCAENVSHDISLKACKNEDWENNWKQFFKPFSVGKKLFIRPTWEDEFDAGDRKILHIEPGLAFGTGGHNTTRLCLETLENYVNPQTNILDIGCGSGILSIASLLFGAQSTVGVDIDKYAVRTAIENGEANGFCEPQYKILCGNLTDKVTGKFDLIVANIVADIIVLFCESVGQFMNKDAVFITSGIIDTREDSVLEAFDKFGFEVLDRREDGGWLCFVTKLK
ncbi:MAG: 50S ribosomal protein L11 methyltransferase [Clostridia bacterium]|nr:50S ribosomal protein L11 methyltransferase [Clostridia bacterium]